MLLLTRQTYVVVRSALIPSLRLIGPSSSSKPALSSPLMILPPLSSYPTSSLTSPSLLPQAFFFSSRSIHPTYRYRPY